MLFLITILSLLKFATATGCNACFDGVCYLKTPIFENYHLSGQLAVDRTENIVYFHYEDDSSVDYTVAFDLDDIRFKIIPNIDFSFARAVDQGSRDVYIGGASGIYKYNPNSNVTAQVGLFDKTIWHMQFKNKIYYTIFQTKGLYTIDSKHSKNVSPLSNYTIDDFIIDFREDLYFLSEGKVYRLKKASNQVTMFLNDVYSLSVDRDEIAHFVNSEKRGLYRLDMKTDRITEVGAFGSGIPLKSVFDNNNNMIYHENNSKKLFYLMPNYGRCWVSSRSQMRRPQDPKGYKAPKVKLGLKDHEKDSSENLTLVISKID